MSYDAGAGNNTDPATRKLLNGDEISSEDWADLMESFLPEEIEALMSEVEIDKFVPEDFYDLPVERQDDFLKLLGRQYSGSKFGF
ncbi:MAG: hypothetical protein ACLFN5_05765 [bacterium]